MKLQVPSVSELRIMCLCVCVCVCGGGYVFLHTLLHPEQRADRGSVEQLKQQQPPQPLRAKTYRNANMERMNINCAAASYRYAC